MTCAVNKSKNINAIDGAPHESPPDHRVRPNSDLHQISCVFFQVNERAVLQRSNVRGA